jgi:hypothetical protein
MHSKRHSSSLLKEVRAFRVGSIDNDVSIFNFLSSIDTPRALTVWLLYSEKQHDQLSALDIDPNLYTNPYRFRLDYVATQFLSKASFLKTSFDRKKVAVSKFLKFEDLCGQTNRRFLSPLSDPLNNGSNVWLLHATKRKIEMILGDYSCDEFVDNANWGPGVSTLINGEEVSGFNKFHAERGITPDLYSLVSPWFSVAYPLWSEHLTRSYGDEWMIFQGGNKIVTVPKNSKTDRVIAIEPGINLWFQKAIGTMIRRRLSRFRIDLNDQSINQQLAWQSSSDETLATVDFSSASDSISLEVVRELIPPRWFQIMDAARSKVGIADGKPFVWKKFSSMGNGFTFELESLIFYAAALAVNEYLDYDSPVSVYGDDVIIDSRSFALFSEFSAFLGFRVNEQKSFSSGHFRESCGSHYFSGVDCKPIFLKERLSNVETVYKLANSLRMLAHRFGFNRRCDASLRDAWLHLYDRVPPNLRFGVPLSAGDTGFISNFDESCPVRARYGIEGFYYRALVSLGVTRDGDGQALTLAHLRLLGTSSPEDLDRSRPQSTRELRQLQLFDNRASCLRYFFQPLRPDRIAMNNSYALRGKVKRSIVRPLAAQWYNLGPWE